MERQLPREPSTVWMAKKLGISGNEVLIFNELFFMTGQGENSYDLGIQKLAEDNNLNEKTVRRVLNSLVKKNLVIKTIMKHRDILLHISEEAIEKIFEQSEEEVPQPVGQNVRSGGQKVRSGGQKVRSGGQKVRSGGQNVRSGGQKVRSGEIIGSILMSITEEDYENDIISLTHSLTQCAHPHAQENETTAPRKDLLDSKVSEQETREALKPCGEKTVAEFVDWLYQGRSSTLLKNEMTDLGKLCVLPDWEMNAVLYACWCLNENGKGLPSELFVRKVIDRISREGIPLDPYETFALVKGRKSNKGKTRKAESSEEPREFTQEDVDLMNELLYKEDDELWKGRILHENQTANSLRL